MLQAILMWTGAVLAFGLLLLMALGPVIVEVDSRWYEHKHNRRRSARKAVTTASVSSEAPAAAPAVRHAA